jgi:hypothetical protein
MTKRCQKSGVDLVRALLLFCGAASQDKFHCRSLFCLSLRYFSHSYRLVCGIGDRCSTVSRERYCQCTSPTKSSNCATNRGHALPSAQPLRMLRLFVTRRSMLLTRQPASIFHSLWANMLDAAVNKKDADALPVLQLTENSTSQLAG